MRDNSHAGGGEVSRKLRKTLGAYALRTQMETVSAFRDCFQDLTVKSVMKFASHRHSVAFLSLSTVHGTDVC